MIINKIQQERKDREFAQNLKKAICKLSQFQVAKMVQDFKGSPLAPLFAIQH